MKTLLAAAAALALLSGCGSTPAEPKAAPVEKLSAADLAASLADIIPTDRRYGGVVIDGDITCDSDLVRVGDVSLCTVDLEDDALEMTGEYTVRTALLDGRRHFSWVVQNAP